MNRRNPYPGVTRIVDRHGKIRWRFRRKGFSCYLSGAYNSAEFRATYDAALSECKAPNRSTTRHGTFKMAVRVVYAQPGLSGQL